MGGLNSTPLSFFRSKKVAVNDDPFERVLPIYYTKQELTEAEFNAAHKAWSLVTSSRASTYVHLKKMNPLFEFSNCSEYFYEIFYERLLEIHPGAKVLFKKNNKRMRQYFIGSFTMLLESVNDVEKFTRSLVGLAHVHNNIGVKALEYGIVGELIMSTLQRCCGDDFTELARIGWVKIFSRMFDIILPIVVNFEVKLCGSLMVSINEPRPGNQTVSSISSNNSCPHSNGNSLMSNVSASANGPGAAGGGATMSTITMSACPIEV